MALRRRARVTGLRSGGSLGRVASARLVGARRSLASTFRIFHDVRQDGTEAERCCRCDGADFSDGGARDQGTACLVSMAGVMNDVEATRDRKTSRSRPLQISRKKPGFVVAHAVLRGDAADRGLEVRLR